MPRYKEADSTYIRMQTRERLLEAAALAFSKEGYDRAKIDDISRSAGFAKGTIYNYFESKRDILLTLIEEIASKHNTFVAGAVQSIAEPTERLEKFFEAGFEWVKDNPHQARLMFNSLNDADADLRQTIFSAYAPMFLLVGQEIVAAGIEGGRFRQLESGPTSGLIMLFYLGAASQTDPEGQPWVNPGQLSDLLLNGLLCR